MRPLLAGSRPVRVLLMVLVTLAVGAAMVAVPSSGASASGASATTAVEPEITVSEPAADAIASSPAVESSGRLPARAAAVKRPRLVVSPAAAEPGASVTVSTRIKPKKRKVVLQQRLPGVRKWARVAAARTKAKGKVAFAVSAPQTAGEVRYRVVAKKLRTAKPAKLRARIVSRDASLTVTPTSKPPVAPPPNGMVVTWAAPTATASAVEGGVGGGAIGMTVTGDVADDLSFQVDQPAAGQMGVAAAADEHGNKFAVFTVSAPKLGRDTQHATVTVLQGTTPVSAPLPVTITIEQLSFDDAWAGPFQPSGSLVANSLGQDVIENQITAVMADKNYTQDDIRSIAADHGLEFVGRVPDSTTVEFRSPGSDFGALDTKMAALEADPRVDYAWPTFLFDLRSAGDTQPLPNDPIWTAPNDDERWHLEAIGAPAAWARGFDGDGVKVALVDSGFKAHLDLDPVGAGLPRSLGSSHGNMTAGLACGRANNGVGTTGVAHSCDLYLIEEGGWSTSSWEDVLDPVSDSCLLIKVFRDALECRKNSYATVVSDLRSAGHTGADVVNVSMGLSTSSRDSDRPGFNCVTDEMNPARSRRMEQFQQHSAQMQDMLETDFADTLWVFAAGNSARDWSPPSSSLDCELFGLMHEAPNVVIVAASLDGGPTLAPYSVRGEGITLAAPGGDVNRMISSTGQGPDGLAQDAGTSFAAPIVTGIAALAKQADPGASPEQLKKCLIAGAEKGGYLIQDELGGRYGVANAPATIDCVLMLKNVKVSGQVWEDDNDNKRRDSEHGIQGVVVELIAPDGSIVDQIATDSSGRYAFFVEPLKVGENYRVRIDRSSDALSGLIPTSGFEKEANGDLSSGGLEATVDFPFIGPPSVGRPEVASRPLTLRYGVVGQEYEYFLPAGRPGTWALERGDLPAGLTLNPDDGGITGVPAVVTSDPAPTFTVSFTDRYGQKAVRDASILIYPSLICGPTDDDCVTVEGTVQYDDLNGRFDTVHRVVGAPVRLKAPRGYEVMETTTDASGHFSFRVKPIAEGQSYIAEADFLLPRLPNCFGWFTDDEFVDETSADLSQPGGQDASLQLWWTGAFVECAPAPGSSNGDPHLITFDGARLDFQAQGEYVVSRGTEDDFEVRFRFRHREEGSPVSWNGGVAARVGESVIAFGDADPTTIDGLLAATRDGEPLVLTGTPTSLPGGATVQTTPRGAVVRWPDGGLLAVERFGAGAVNYFLTLGTGQRGKVEGLLGNANGSAVDDLHGPNGTRVTTSQDRYGPFSERWLVPVKDSWFQFPIAPALPGEVVLLSSLDPAAVDAARATCAEAGVTHPVQLERCVYDVAVSGDESVAADYAHVSEGVEGSVAADGLVDLSASAVAVDRGQVIEGSIEAPLQGRAFRINLKAGEKLRLTATHCPQEGSFQIVLLTADGDPVGAATQGGGCGAFVLPVAPHAGDYVIPVRDSGGYTGDFTIEQKITDYDSLVVESSTNAAGATAVQQTLTIRTSASGALVGGTDTITVTAPEGGVLPSTCSSYRVTVSGTTRGACVSLSGDKRTATLKSGLPDIPAGTVFTVTVDGVTNPPTAGEQVWALRTSSDDASSASSVYVERQALSGVKVAEVSTVAAGAEKVQYTFTGKTSSSGALVGGLGTVMVTAPEGGVLPSTCSSYRVTVSGTTRGACVSLSGDKRTATLKSGLPDIPAGTVFTVTVDGVTNPPTAGEHVWELLTSSDDGMNASVTYTP